jgi:hypothetical protein
MNDTFLWQIRHFVYQHFAETTRPPSVDETARHFGISPEKAAEYFRELHNRHAIFLNPDVNTTMISVNTTVAKTSGKTEGNYPAFAMRMAWPFSAIPTDFKVHANGKTYFANCAWDMLGIPAALHTDAVIEAVCTESHEKVRLEIKDGHVTLSQRPERSEGAGEGSLPRQTETLRSHASTSAPPPLSAALPQSDMLLVHFPLPFARWYEDLTFT